MTSVKVRIAHECIESVPSCRCSILADEPSWKCEIHGGYWSSPKCRVCARFMKRLPIPEPVEVEGSMTT